MKLPPATLEELCELSAAVRENRCGPRQAARLNARVIGDPSACDVYARYILLEAMLELEFGTGNLPTGVSASSIESTVTTSLAPTVSSTLFHSTLNYFSSGWPVAYLIATVVVGIGLLAGSLTPVSRPHQIARQSLPPSQLFSEPKMGPVGRITGMVDCQWIDPSTEASNGAHVPLGRKYALSSGLMEITYNTGAKVILEGPVTYEVESPVGGFLSVGKLTARLEKKVASGQWPVASRSEIRNLKSELSNPQFLIPNPLFAVRTPTAVVTDLGTEFGVEVSKEGHTTSYVFRGKVQVQLAAHDGQQGQSIQLSKNESARVEQQSGGGGLMVRRVAVDPAGFIRVEQLPKLVEERKLTPLRRWQAYSQELRRDPALVAYYTFEKHELASTTLPNQSAAGNVLDGKVEGAEWVYGRLPGKLALLFHGPRSGDKVVLPEPERFNFTGPFSVAVWFKVAQLSGRHQGLVVKGDRSWRFQQASERNKLVFGSNYGPTSENGVPGRIDVNDRRWHLGVAVYEPVGNVARKRLYVDGRLDTADESPLPLHLTDDPVWLGSNCGKSGREFQGWIDEVAILGRALSVREVQEMFVAGSPAGPIQGASNKDK